MRRQERRSQGARAATHLVNDHGGGRGKCETGWGKRVKWSGAGSRGIFLHCSGKEARDYKGVRENLVGSKIGWSSALGRKRH